jgi:hypothetical protein
LNDVGLPWLGVDVEGGLARRDVLGDGHPAYQSQHVLMSLRGVCNQCRFATCVNCVDKIYFVIL